MAQWIGDDLDDGFQSELGSLLARGRSTTQSFDRIGLPGGYSKSTTPIKRNPAFRHVAFEAACSTRGYACSTAASPAAAAR